MGGFKNLFKNMSRMFDAKAQNAADTIESENSTEFGKQDVFSMEEELKKVTGNIGTVKGEMAVLKEKIADIKSQVKKHDEDALALDERGMSDLALQHSEAAEGLESQLESLKLALKTQEDILADQMKSKNELNTAIQQAKADLVTLKAMNDAASANEKLAEISTDSSTSALASFKSRKEEAKKRLIKSQAIKEESSSETSLQQETEKALGRSGGSSRLEKLKAKRTGSKAG